MKHPRFRVPANEDTESAAPYHPIQNPRLDMVTHVPSTSLFFSLTPTRNNLRHRILFYCRGYRCILHEPVHTCTEYMGDSLRDYRWRDLESCRKVTAEQ